jgi:CBS domain-containing protein
MVQQQVKRGRLVVGSFMSSPVIAVHPGTKLKDAVTVMTANNIGNLVVLASPEGNSGEEPAGVLTERELLRYLALQKELPDIPAEQAPLRKFARLDAGTSVDEAAGMMIAKKLRLIVFHKDDATGKVMERMAGIVTASDLLKAFLETGRNPTIAGAMSMKVYSLGYDRTILAAVKMMYKQGIGSVIVEKDDTGTPYGIFTERDLLKKVLSQNINIEDKVGRYSTHPLQTARLRIGAATAGKLMLAAGIKRLPLVSRGKIAGIVTARDLVEAFQRGLR